ncbi:MAG: class II fructose-bisphosphate aldolase [Gammaproteobacteria bacterium]|nr:class II fructose-bisphosphate aldolase [Gammaproteobacteria bacterium]
MRRNTPLDLNRLQALNEALGIPLAIHDGADSTDEQYRHLIARGIAKITYASALAEAAAQRIHANARQDTRADYTSLLRDVRDAVSAETEHVITLLGAAGRAEEVSKTARVWHEVEHCIVYNSKNLGDSEVEQMMARGRASLSTIPGVRRVFTGRTLRPDAPYRYCWLVRFASPAVVTSYRDHPTHVAFADTQFRPQAANRISIDFEALE